MSIEGFGEQCNVVVLGDLNARVGDVVVEDVVGRYGVPGRNDSAWNGSWWWVTPCSRSVTSSSSRG